MKPQTVGHIGITIFGLAIVFVYAMTGLIGNGVVVFDWQMIEYTQLQVVAVIALVAGALFAVLVYGMICLSATCLCGKWPGQARKVAVE